MTEGQDVTTTQEIIDALRELRDEPYGSARSARTEELVETAERLGLDDALPTTMLELLSAYEYGDEVRKSPVLFSRILKLYKEHPEHFNDWATHRVFWCFKWITSSLLSVPEMPLAAIEGWIGQMREHFAAEDKPLVAVYTSRYHLAAHTGVDVDLSYELWATRPRDEFSDCEACEARNRGVYWVGKGDDARALLEWQPVLDGKLGCAEEPAATISRALLPLVREGRLEDAVSFHRSGYRATKGKVSMDAEVSRHLEFLALTGNRARGLELLAENRGRFDSTTDAANRLAFLGGVRVLLTRLVAEDGADVPVPGPGGRTYPAAELLAEATAQSDELARRFDARNGTTHQGDLQRNRWTREPLTTEPLPLGVRVAPSLGTTPPIVAAATEPVPEDFATLLAQAREALELGKPGSGHLWDSVAERVEESDLDDVLRAELASRSASKHVKKGAWDEAAAGALETAQLFEKAGRPGRAIALRSRAAWCAFMAAENPGEQSWEELDSLLAAADSLLSAGEIDPEDYTTVLHCRAAAAMQTLSPVRGSAQEQSAADRARFDREVAQMRACAIRLAVPTSAAVAEAMAGDALARDGRFEESATRWDSAIALTEEAQRPWSLPQFLAPYGQLLNRAGRLDEAADVLHRALTLLAEWPGGDLTDAGILLELGANRMAAEDFGAAVTHLTSAAAKFDRVGNAVPAAHARSVLGQALLASGRRTDGIAVLESLLDEQAEPQLDPPQRGQLRLELGKALMAEGEPRAAAEVFARLADLVADWPDRAVHTMVACELVGALYAAELWEQGEIAVERALALQAEGPNSAAVCAMLRAAAEAEYRNRGAEGVERALVLLQRSDEVNVATKEVDKVYRRWPETGYNADERTKALARANRDEEALAAAEKAIAAWQLGGRAAIVKRAEAVRVAAVIEGHRLGRRKQAIGRISPMISECRTVGLEQGVRILTKLAEDLSAGS